MTYYPPYGAHLSTLDLVWSLSFLGAQDRPVAVLVIRRLVYENLLGARFRPSASRRHPELAVHTSACSPSINPISKQARFEGHGGGTVPVGNMVGHRRSLTVRSCAREAGQGPRLNPTLCPAVGFVEVSSPFVHFGLTKAQLC
jgi:hypothetical protein